MRLSATFRVQAVQIDLVGGSIAEPGRSLDALVSSDDNYLSHSGGVAAALWEAAGEAFAAGVMVAPPRLSLGDVHVTGAGSLPARWLLHAVTIDFDENRTIAPAHLPALYERVFRVAAERGCSSVGLPILAAGSARVSPSASLRSFADALQAVNLGELKAVVLFVLPELFDLALDRVSAAFPSQPLDGRWLITAALKAFPLDLDDSLLAAWMQAAPGDHQRVALAALLRHVVDVGRSRKDQLRFWEPERERLSASIGEAWMTFRRVEQGKGALTRPELRVAAEALRDLARIPIRAGRQDRAAADSAPLPLEFPDDGDSRSASLLSTSSPVSVVQGPEADLAFEYALPQDERPDRPQADQPPPSPAGASAAPSQGEEIDGIRDVPAGRRLEPELPPVGTVSSHAEGGTGAVRALHRLLLERLRPASLSRLHRLLEQQGYRGREEFRLLEYLVEHRDLTSLLTELFDLFALCEIAEQLGGTVPDPPSHRRAAEVLLEILGFQTLRRPVGLGAARAAVRRVATRLEQTRQVEGALRGNVIEVGVWLECICHALLRFVSQVVFEKAPEVLLRGGGQLRAEEDLARVGLGRLFTLIGSIEARIERDNPPRLELLPSARRPLLPPHGKGQLPSLRNHFAHWNQQPPEATASELRMARDFVSGVDGVLTYLAEPESRVFPRVLVITGIHYDRWGRRLVYAESEDGKEETIFTESQLRPGETYFLHPLSNPIRVDPLLVPAGDLRFPDTDSE